jgi:hypothetical protein
VAASRRDWVGYWYAVARSRGVNDIASIGRVDLRAGTVDWTDFSHATVDGVGRLGELLRARGYRIPELPRSRETRPPGPWRALRILLGARGLARPRKLRWRTRRPVVQAPRHGFPWTVLTREETERLERAARARGVSVNAWLLARLSAILWPALLEEGERGPWLFPVNMRGVAGPLPDHANVASAILIDCGPGTDDRAIHAQVRARLAAGMHWATWWILHVGRVVGRRGVRWISHRRERSAEYVGTFSNMGAWPPEGSAPGALDENEAWLCTPPGTPNFPVSAGLMAWNGRLSITLKVHPSVTADQGLAARALAELRRQATLAPETSEIGSGALPGPGAPENGSSSPKIR